MNIFIKNLIKISLSVLLLSSSSIVLADDVILYGASGDPVAFVDTAGDSTLYLSSGDPIGYVYNNGAVYTYSGQHVGWYNEGVLYDKNGYIVAFTDTKKPESVLIKPIVADLTKVKRTHPAIVPTAEVVTTPPTYVYQLSPTPINAIFTVQPVE